MVMTERDDPATFVYDDDCGFCTWWAEFFERRSDLDVVGFSATTTAERERLPDDWAECAHLLTDERVYSCGEAIEAALERTGLLPGGARTFLNQFADYGRFRERLYREAADRRDLWGRFVSSEPPARRSGETGE
jgi:predicted DCC family thiol-disulfide oxidoreductase YuxK